MTGLTSLLLDETHCHCPACAGGELHASDCSVHNAPADPRGECDCGTSDMAALNRITLMVKRNGDLKQMMEWVKIRNKLTRDDPILKNFKKSLDRQGEFD